MKSIGAALTLCTVAGLARPGCLHAAEEELRGFQPTKGLEEVMARILYYASLAPSGHNTQPWAVRMIKPEELIVCQDPSRRLPAVDPAQRELILSLGAFMENLNLAAAVHGFAAEIEVTATVPSETDIARIRLKKTKASDYPLQRLELRRTIRKGQLSEPIRQGDLKSLLAPAKGESFFFPVGSQEGKFLSEYAAESFAFQAHRKVAQEELSRWIRFSNTEAKRHRDGLTTATMDITGLTGLVVRLFLNSADAVKPSFVNQGIALTRQLVQEGGGWIIITGSGATVADLIESGRKFQRLALLSRELGIGIHPMTQQIEEKEWTDKTTALVGGLTPQFVLRIGYVRDYPSPVSPRRPVEWFTSMAGKG
ncbi:MAG: hypothetical protein KBG09_05290 [Syntrophobacterales bacterium]|nr:hypothetical protein [Syntrophobacterales bacterium]